MRESTLISLRPQAFIRLFGLVRGLFGVSDGFGVSRQGKLLASAALTSLLLLEACGSKDPPRERERPVLPIAAVRDAPADYIVEDPECQATSNPQPLTHASIPTWNGDDVILRDVTFKDTGTRASLVNTAISQTIFGEELERYCDGSSSLSETCRDQRQKEQRWLTVNPGRSLRVCRDGYTYSRRSYEGVALASAHYIQLARDRYLGVSRDSKAPQSLSLSILPQMADYYPGRNEQGQDVRIKRYVTHNLAYFPENNSIAVFPESKRRAEKARGYFWESGFVLAHEYGHHIDFHRHGTTYRVGGLSYDPTSHILSEARLASSDQPSQSRRSLLGSALAEGFADLLAYYTGEASSGPIVGLPDIGVNRDVGSRYFATGSMKVLTDERLQTFFGEIRSEEPLSAAHRFTDIHTIGAIFAHAADQIFKQVLKARIDRNLNSPEGVDLRYRLALDWMDALTKSMADLSPEAARQELTGTVSKGLEYALGRYLQQFPLNDSEAASQLDNDLKRNLCLTTEALLPGLGTLPFADAMNSCPS